MGLDGVYARTLPDGGENTLVPELPVVQPDVVVPVIELELTE
ncbi:MAG: hypothetical protein ACP5JG_00670 [Anaerolineae bacterium]